VDEAWDDFLSEAPTNPSDDCSTCGSDQTGPFTVSGYGFTTHCLNCGAVW
jgi:hypothetical protein